jgi:hypothetical protein
MIVPGSELIASALAPLTSFTPQLAYVLLQWRRLPEPGMNRRIIKSWLSFIYLFPIKPHGRLYRCQVQNRLKKRKMTSEESFDVPG